MQTLVAQRGDFQLMQVHEPPLTSHSVTVRLHWSAMSYGTENNTLSGQKTEKILQARHYWNKALELLKKERSSKAVWQRFSRLRRGLSPLGYSAVGEVVACGRRVKMPLAAGSIVHVGGEYACHSEIVSVPQNFVFPLIDQTVASSPVFALATIASVPIHAVLHARDSLPVSMVPTVLVVGGGIIGTFAGLFARSCGYDVSLYDIAPDTLADTFLSRTPSPCGYDMVFVCTPSMHGIEKHLAFANDGCVLSVVGETPLEVERSVLEDKYMTVRFCKSFGYGRGDKAYEFGCREVADSRFPHTIRVNIGHALDLLKKMEPQLLPQINIMSPGKPAPFDKKINVFKWI